MSHSQEGSAGQVEKALVWRGKISLASVQQNSWHALLADHAGFEDGTVNYLLIPGVEIGLHHLEAVEIDAIRARVHALTS